MRKFLSSFPEFEHTIRTYLETTTEQFYETDVSSNHLIDHDSLEEGIFAQAHNSKHYRISLDN